MKVNRECAFEFPGRWRVGLSASARQSSKYIKLEMMRLATYYFAWVV